MIVKKTVNVILTVEVELDASKFDAAFMHEFREQFYEEVHPVTNRD